MENREAIKMLKTILGTVYLGNRKFIEAVEKAISALEKQEQDRWIPVTERLPKEGRQVLVYAVSVHYAIAKYDEMMNADGTWEKQWVTYDAWKPMYKIKGVLAWRPLPEPYTEEES